jgi:hypothetical protein
MTQEQFKEILESIEPGLFEKFKENSSFPIEDLTEYDIDIHSWINSSFFFALSPEGYAFWLKVDEKYQEKLKELSNENRV